MSWKKSLKRKLQAAEPSELRLAIIGVGNELNGDDGVGVHILRGLEPALREHHNLLFVNGGLAPENQTGAIRRFQPNFVLIIDAADVGKSPGEAFLVDPNEIDGLSASSHSLPLSVLSAYLTQELACEVVILGVQPYLLEFDKKISPVLQNSVNDIVDTLVLMLLD